MEIIRSSKKPDLSDLDRRSEKIVAQLLARENNGYDQEEIYISKEVSQYVYINSTNN